MKKASNKKFSSPSKLIGKIFQRQKSCDEAQMTEGSSSAEIESLKKEIDRLKSAFETLTLDTENKEIQLAKLARDKEKLSMNLAKIRRSNVNLTQQLEDERNFYYKEKEIYCQEMNEYKKLKKVLSNTNVASQIDQGQEIEKLKKTLEQTLRTNYNLSVKFLRMRETKNQLSITLKKTEEEHRRVVNDLKVKIEVLTAELDEILNQKFDAPLSPSNKKYLQLVNQNSSLVYENLYLQMQVDNLNLRLKRHKLQRTKSDNNNRILHTGAVREKRNSNLKLKSGEDKVVKIFEREKRPDLPTVTILNEKEVTLKPPTSERKLHLPVVNESKLEVFQVSEVQSQTSAVDSSGTKKRSRSAPKIVQSVGFKDVTSSTKRDLKI